MAIKGVCSEQLTSEEKDERGLMVSFITRENYATKWHSFGYTHVGNDWYMWVNYGPMNVTGSLWIIPGTWSEWE